MRCFSILSLLFLTATALVGCTEADPFATVAVAANTHCPIMGHKVADDGGRVEYEDKTVGFCCPGCIKKWNALSDEEKVARLASPPGDDHQHLDDRAEGDHESHEGTSQHEGHNEALSYVCPMKCAPAQNENGRFPVCSMQLVKADANNNDAEEAPAAPEAC